MKALLGLSTRTWPSPIRALREGSLTALVVGRAGSSPAGWTVCGNRAMFLSNHRLSDLDLFSGGTRPHGHMFTNANDRYLPKQFLASVYGRVAGSCTRVTPGTWILCRK